MTNQSPQSQEPAPSGEVRIPVTIHARAKHPTVTYVLIGFTILMYGLQWLSTSLTKGTDWPFLLGGKINEFILQGQFWRLITPMFLHANILHIAFNMYALFIVGTSLEQSYGHWRFLLLYFIGGFTGNVMSFLLSTNPSLGASTAVFGLVAAQAVFVYKSRKLFGSRARSMLVNLLMIIGVNLVIGLQPGIDNWGHLGGLIGGAIFAWVGGPILKAEQTIKGIEIADIRKSEDVWWGFLLSAGLFIAAVIGRLILGK